MIRKIIQRVIRWVNETPFYKFALYCLAIMFLSSIIQTLRDPSPTVIEPYKPIPGPIDTRKYSKGLYNDGSIPIKKVPDLTNTIRVQVVNGTRTQGVYDVEMDFEELMYQLGIDPEDIRDYIGD